MGGLTTTDGLSSRCLTAPRSGGHRPPLRGAALAVRCVSSRALPPGGRPARGGPLCMRRVIWSAPSWGLSRVVSISRS